MANKDNNILDLEEVNNLLPAELKIDTLNKIERSVYRTSIGKPLPIINSKLYPNNIFWYSCLTKYFKELGAEFICFTAGIFGIIVIPIDVVLHYNQFSGWKDDCKKGRQYHVRIKKHIDDTISFYNFNEPKENIDITQYLIKKT